MNTAVPVVRDVVLVGGGHSHALLIRRWAMDPLPGVRLTLISRDVLTPYSGMLPGLIAGHYTAEQVHIDLLRLCAWAGVRFIEAEVTGLDLTARAVQLADRPAIEADVISLDTGSTPALEVPGSAEHAVPVKPVSALHERWQAIVAQTENATAEQPVHLGVVGSGAGGFEVLLAVQHALRDRHVRCHWFVRGERPLSGQAARVGELALAAALEKSIMVHTGFAVSQVTTTGVCANPDRSVALDHVLWCTGAVGPAWPASAGLAVDERGFVLTRSTLQSTSHPWVFATGDIGSHESRPHPKAGVFAVRQAPVLFDNLRRFVLSRSLKRYRPQRHFLTLMACGHRSAIASRWSLAGRHDRFWWLKDLIDQRFMQRFRDLPARKSMPEKTTLAPSLLTRSGLLPQDVDADAMRCSGCGAKVGSGLLEHVLAELTPWQRPDVVRGFHQQGTARASSKATADVAVIDPQQRWLVQSVDQLKAIVDDPWLFGRLAALHALSDVFTQDCEPQSAQVLMDVPFAADDVIVRDLSQLMQGVLNSLNASHCTLVGGHTAEGADLQLGLVINALMSPQQEAAMSPSAGDVLVLTQPLGIGILFAGLMRSEARGVDIRDALAMMLQSNGPAADILRAHQVQCLTDVTGFGLLGHAADALRSSALRAQIHFDDVPVLPGALALAEQGVHSSLWRHNQRYLLMFEGIDRVSPGLQCVLSDPQTGGGLLGAVTAEQAPACITALKCAGYAQAGVIGHLLPE